MSRKRRGNRRRSIATLAELFDHLAPDEIDEAREELRALGVDPSGRSGKVGARGAQVDQRAHPSRAFRCGADTKR
jgi:hypothetical protein